MLNEKYEEIKDEIIKNVESIEILAIMYEYILEC